MTDETESDAGKAKVDVADLKARLGLKGGGGSAGAAKREASPEEAFEAFGPDKTPLPAALPEAPIAPVEGGGRIRPVPLVVGGLVVLVVGLGLGHLLGQASAGQEQRDAHARLSVEKLEWFNTHKTSSGGATLDGIAAMQESLSDAVGSIDALEAKGGGPLELEKTFESLLATMKRYTDEGTFFPSSRVAEDVVVVYTDDPMLKATRFAQASELLFKRVSGALAETTQYLRMSQPSGAARRLVVLEAGNGQLGGVDVPLQQGTWVRQDTEGKPATGTPGQVQVNAGEQWEVKVMVEGAEEPIQRPTTLLLDLDLAPIYEGQRTATRLLMVDRLAALTRELHDLARDVDWPELEKALQGWADKATE